MYSYKDTARFVENKRVFCGIDVHERHWDLAFYCSGEVIEQIRIVGRYERLVNHVRHHYGTARQILFVYEAGYSGFYLYRRLHEAGYGCIITPPNRVPSASGRIKTDKRDARKLAHLLAGSLLKQVHVPGEHQEAVRQLFRLRSSYQMKLTRVRNQIKSQLHLLGMEPPVEAGRSWTRGYLRWLASVEVPDQLYRDIFTNYLEEYHFFRVQVASLTRKLKDLSKREPFAASYALISRCKGVGLITGMTFLVELGDIKRFNNVIEFSGYLGLSPSQHSSGPHIRLGHITHEGNVHVRRVLVESAWTVIRYDASLRRKYDRICSRGSNGKRAIVAVAHSLAIRLRRCLLDQTPYVMGNC